MAKKIRKKITTVREHPLHVPVSEKNPTAMNQLKRAPNHEELILEYKGLLRSKTGLKSRAFEIYREHYDLLKKK